MPLQTIFLTASEMPLEHVGLLIAGYTTALGVLWRWTTGEIAGGREREAKALVAVQDAGAQVAASITALAALSDQYGNLLAAVTEVLSLMRTVAARDAEHQRQFDEVIRLLRETQNADRRAPYESRFNANG